MQPDDDPPEISATMKWWYAFIITVFVVLLFNIGTFSAFTKGNNGALKMWMLAILYVIFFFLVRLVMF